MFADTRMSKCLCCGADILCGDAIESLCDNCRVLGHTGAIDCDACRTPIEPTSEGVFVAGWNKGVEACIQEVATMDAEDDGFPPEWCIRVVNRLRQLKDDAQPVDAEPHA